MNYAVIALTVVGGIEAVLLWVMVHGLKRLDRVETRLAHLTDAVTLLAETAESGFRANAVEMTRIADRAAAAPPAASRAATRRMATAARKGRSVTEIAAQEQVSEGEVNLRVHLAQAAAAARSKTRGGKEAGDGPVRS